MIIYLRISSKCKNTLKNFLEFIFNYETLSMSIISAPKPKNKKFLTILKSPHINKDAQEQFEFKLYNKIIVLKSPQPSLLILMFKHLINYSFPGIGLELQLFSDKKFYNKFLLSSINPENSSFNFFLNNKFSSAIKSKNYLNLFDSYGEIVLKSYNKKIQHL